jgi:hypothetical protein
MLELNGLNEVSVYPDNVNLSVKNVSFYCHFLVIISFESVSGVASFPCIAAVTLQNVTYLKAMITLT